MKLTERLSREDYEKWVKDAEGSSFFAVPISEMDRSDMLIVIGYLLADLARNREQYTHDLNVLTGMRRAVSSRLNGL